MPVYLRCPAPLPIAKTVPPTRLNDPAEAGLVEPYIVSLAAYPIYEAFMRNHWASCRGIIGLLLLGMGLVSVPAYAQSMGNGLDSLSPLDQLRKQATARSAASPLAPMEGALDPDTYRVGPGDIFAVTIATLNDVLQIPVTADGWLMLPDAGSVKVAGQSLAEARRAALAALTPQYSNVAVEVTLAQPRQFYVHVAGAVSTPGRYLAMPVERVASVIALAFADTSRVPVRNPRFRPSLRDVTLERADGTSLSIDLQRYLATGDRAHNPYLNDGDVVRVGAYDPAQHAIFVGGAVPNAGTYPHRADDTVAGLLILAGANLASPTDSVRITSSRTGQASQYPLSGALGDIVVEPLDRLHVYTAVEARGTMHVEGQVRFPGMYPIIEGETTLQEVVQQAGGLRTDALARGAYLQRQTVLGGGEALGEQGAADVARAMQRRLHAADTLSYTLSLRLADLDFLSRIYLAEELRLGNRVALNLAAALQPGAAPVLVRDGDRLVVPEDDGTVLVVGQVNRPGRIAAQSSTDVTAYLAAAGQPTSQAGSVYVIKAGSGRFLPATQATVETGDIIFVDRLQDASTSAETERLALQYETLALERERAQYDQRIRRSQIWVQVASVAAALASAYSTYLLTRRQ